MDVGTINFLVQFKKAAVQFYDSGFVFGLKIFLAVYVSVLLVDIILIIIVQTPGMFLRVLRTGANVPVAHKAKMQKRWEKVMARLQSGKADQYKAAVLEADEVANDILARVGYPGNNMGERLEGITPFQLETVEELKGAHELRNEIVRKADLVLDRKKAQETIEVYQKTLEAVDFL